MAPSLCCAPGRTPTAFMAGILPPTDLKESNKQGGVHQGCGQGLAWGEVCGQLALKAPECGSQRGQPGEVAQAGGLQLALVWPKRCFREIQNSC